MFGWVNHTLCVWCLFLGGTSQKLSQCTVVVCCVRVLCALWMGHVVHGWARCWVVGEQALCVVFLVVVFVCE